MASSLFEVKGNPQLDKDSFTFSKDSKYPYFTRTVFNNGILGYVDFLDEEHLIKGNSLAVGMMGMRFFYMKKDFYAGQFTKTIFPLFDGFNESIALWFISWFNKSSDKYHGLLVRDFENAFNNTELIVPYKNGKIAIDYIESRIRELEESRIRELKAFLIAAGFEDCTLTETEKNAISNKHSHWEEISIGELFTIRKGKRLTKSDMIPGDINFIGATSENNGITNHIGNSSHLHPGNTITVTYNGSVGQAFYQTNRFWASDDVNVLYPHNNLCENLALFYLAPIRKKGETYAYSFKWTKEKMSQDKIWIPCKTENGQTVCDKVFMDTYVNAIKKQCIASLKKEIFHEHQAYEQAIEINLADNNNEDEEGKIIVQATYLEGCVPLYTLRAACGKFSGEGLWEKEGWVDASGNGFTPNPKSHFAVRAKGDSMYPDIKDGDICVFEWYNQAGGTREGDIVLAECNGFDDEATIKKYHSVKKHYEDGSWEHEKIELIPLNKDYDVIELDSEDKYRTIGIFKCVL